MKIGELIDNGEFSFNASFKIYKYEPPEIDFEDGETTLMFDSDNDFDIDYKLLCQDITAINQGADGAIEIEYVEWEV